MRTVPFPTGKSRGIDFPQSAVRAEQIPPHTIISNRLFNHTLGYSPQPYCQLNTRVPALLPERQCREVGTRPLAAGCLSRMSADTLGQNLFASRDSRRTLAQGFSTARGG